MMSVTQKVITYRDVNKSHILQFLPSKLGEISKKKKFIYKGKSLKVSYLIDLTHGIILKYYFKKENIFPLYSMILREKYGQYYNYYVNFLIENGIISLVKNYKKGKSSKIYSLNKSILSSEISRFRNSDKIILKKHNKKSELMRLDPKSSPIPLHVRNKLVEDINHFKVNYDESLEFLRKNMSDIDSINRNLYSIESIKDNNLFFHFDKFGRFHTNFTILKSEIRKKFLTVDGDETVEIDIKNSQPLFLSKLIKLVNTRWVSKEEFDNFCFLVESGEFYNYLVKNLKLSNKEESKKLVYKVFFGQNRRGSIVDERFKSLFPTIHNFIKLYKKENSDYRSLSHHLQKMESNLIFNKIINRIIDIDPEIKVLTIHDSIIVSKKYGDIISRILDEEISKV